MPLNQISPRKVRSIRRLIEALLTDGDSEDLPARALVSVQIHLLQDRPAYDALKQTNFQHHYPLHADPFSTFAVREGNTTITVFGPMNPEDLTPALDPSSATSNAS